MRKFEKLKAQLRQQYPFLRKTAVNAGSTFDAETVFRKYENEALLVVMIGCQGSGKTTYCQEHFQAYPVISLDEILIKYLENDVLDPGEFSEADEMNVQAKFLKSIACHLEKEKVAIVDFAANNIEARIALLLHLQGKYTKVISLVLDPSFEQIEKQILDQIDLRMRPGLFEEVVEEYNFFQIQLMEKFFEMGMDEIYLI